MEFFLTRSCVIIRFTETNLGPSNGIFANFVVPYLRAAANIILLASIRVLHSSSFPRKCDMTTKRFDISNTTLIHKFIKAIFMSLAQNITLQSRVYLFAESLCSRQSRHQHHLDDKDGRVERKPSKDGVAGV